jgi:hypothetical protein
MAKVEQPLLCSRLMSAALAPASLQLQGNMPSESHWHAIDSSHKSAAVVVQQADERSASASASRTAAGRH